MGSACCVAAREKPIQSRPSSDTFHRNSRCSPTWSFRWENRGRVAGEETSLSWSSDGVARNEGFARYHSASGSEEGSPLEHFQRHTWQKPVSQEGSPLEDIQAHIWKKISVSEGTAGQVETPASDHFHSRNIVLDASLEQAKESTESNLASYTSPAKLSVSFPSNSSLSASPLSYLQPGSSTPSRWHRHSPGHHLLRQVSESRIPGLRMPNGSVSDDKPMLPTWSSDSTRGFRGGSSDGWSMHAFSELVANSHRDRWSFDSESFGFNHDKLTRSSSQISDSSCGDSQTCGVCLKLLSEKSSWSSHKIIATNELSVVAVLTCGHVFHADCLESMTAEISKYDPACPVCSFGEKQTLKLSDKVWKAEIEKAKNKRRSKNRVGDSDFNGSSVVFDRLKGSMNEGKGPKLSSSSSMKGSFGRPFLKRHFSFGSKGTKTLPENHSTRKKRFFWVKSSKE